MASINQIRSVKDGRYYEIIVNRNIDFHIDHYQRELIFQKIPILFGMMLLLKDEMGCISGTFNFDF